MSGGSFDYLCYKIRDAAGRLENSDNPLERALAADLEHLARTMKAVEWYWSCDWSQERSDAAIREWLGRHQADDAEAAENRAIVAALRGMRVV